MQYNRGNFEAARDLFTVALTYLLGQQHDNKPLSRMIKINPNYLKTSQSGLLEKDDPFKLVAGAWTLTYCRSLAEYHLQQFERACIDSSEAVRLFDLLYRSSTFTFSPSTEEIDHLATIHFVRGLALMQLGSYSNALVAVKRSIEIYEEGVILRSSSTSLVGGSKLSNMEHILPPKLSHGQLASKAPSSCRRLSSGDQDKVENNKKMLGKDRPSSGAKQTFSHLDKNCGNESGIISAEQHAAALKKALHRALLQQEQVHTNEFPLKKSAEVNILSKCGDGDGIEGRDVRIHKDSKRSRQRKFKPSNNKASEAHDIHTKSTPDIKSVEGKGVTISAMATHASGRSPVLLASTLSKADYYVSPSEISRRRRRAKIEQTDTCDEPTTDGKITIEGRRKTFTLVKSNASTSSDLESKTKSTQEGAEEKESSNVSQLPADSKMKSNRGSLNNAMIMKRAPGNQQVESRPSHKSSSDLQLAQSSTTPRVSTNTLLSDSKTLERNTLKIEENIHSSESNSGRTRAARKSTQSLDVDEIQAIGKHDEDERLSDAMMMMRYLRARRRKQAKESEQDLQRDSKHLMIQSNRRLKSMMMRTCGSVMLGDK